MARISTVNHSVISTTTTQQLTRTAGNMVLMAAITFEAVSSAERGAGGLDSLEETAAGGKKHNNNKSRFHFIVVYNWTKNIFTGIEGLKLLS